MQHLPFPISHRLRAFALFSVIVIALVIGILSLIPSADLPPVAGSDKVKHAIAYMALAAPLAVWLGPRRWMTAMIVAILYGVSIEIAQYLAPTGRSGSYLDAAANAIGALAGAGLAKLCFKSI